MNTLSALLFHLQVLFTFIKMTHMVDLSDFNDFCIDTENDALYSINGNRRSTENVVNFCNFLRQSDTNVTQNSIKKYDNKEIEKETESKKIHFILGESPENKRIIANVKMMVSVFFILYLPNHLLSCF